jgi:hypothetical protein
VIDLDLGARFVRGAIAAVARDLAARADGATTLEPPYEARGLAEDARRIALHIVPLAAVTDVASSSSAPHRRERRPAVRGHPALLAQRLPYPPRIEASSLGDAAVLTGARG